MADAIYYIIIIFTKQYNIISETRKNLCVICNDIGESGQNTIHWLITHIIILDNQKHIYFRKGKVI